jgi:hypothetical protein
VNLGAGHHIVEAVDLATAGNRDRLAIRTSTPDAGPGTRRLEQSQRLEQSSERFRKKYAG